MSASKGKTPRNDSVTAICIDSNKNRRMSEQNEALNLMSVIVHGRAGTTLTSNGQDRYGRLASTTRSTIFMGSGQSADTASGR